MVSVSKSRSLAKAATWRILATITTIILVYTFTGEIAIAFGVGFVEIFAKFIIYYVHERVWARIQWGITR